MLHGRTTQVYEAEKQAAESIMSIQDIAAAQLAQLNKEIMEMKMHSSQFL